MIDYPFDKKFLQNVSSRVVRATDDVKKTKQQIGHMFFNGKLQENGVSFDRLVVSYAMAKYGIKDFVNVSSFEAHNGLGGFYNHEQNLLSINKVNAENKQNMHRTIETIFHEICHKKQLEQKEQAKIFGPKQKEFIITYDNHFATLLGADFRQYYFLNPSEIEAGLSGTTEAIKLLEEIKNNYGKTSRDFSSHVTSQLHDLYETKHMFEKTTHAYEKSFLSNLDGFYNNAQNLFKAYFSSFNNLADGRFGKEDEDNLQKIKAAFSDVSNSSKTVNLVWALSSICSYLPKRENVASVLDVAYALGPQVSAIVFNNFVSNRIPLAKSDFTKLFLQTSFHPDNLKMLGKNINFFDEIDEAFLAKNMVMSGGFFRAISAIDYLKQTPHSSKIDFDIVMKEVLKYPKEPIAQIGEHNIFGCYDIVNIAMNKFVFENPEYEKYPNKLMFLRYNCISNLGVIVDNCGGVIANNPKFFAEVNKFLNNPLQDIEYENPETISEKSAMFPSNVADKVENLIEQKRNNPQEESSGPDGGGFASKIFEFFTKKTSGQIYPSMDLPNINDNALNQETNYANNDKNDINLCKNDTENDEFLQ